jgi:hypothetical protein
MMQTIQVQSKRGPVEVIKKDPINGPSTEWEALFPDGKRKSFYGNATEVEWAVNREINQEIWGTQ